jgi:8-oxo-dGTP pyrophosphatase MutT (NUDIX family)
MKVVTAHTAVFDENGRVLMALGRDIPLWIFPGGHVEEGEEPEETAKRELFEEVGINGSDFVLVGEYVIRGKKIKRFYKAFAPSNSPITVQEHEVRVAKWFDPKELPREMRTYDKIKFEDLMKFDGEISRREFDTNPNYDLWPLFLKFPLWMVFVMFCYYRWAFRTKILRRG